jgi:hypothetical protein
MLFDEILQTPELFALYRETCEENDVCINLENINKNNILILKIDAFYSSKNMHNPPPSIDCLILVKCINDSYNLYLFELKDVNAPKRIKITDIESKFNITINDFLNNRFKQLFDKYPIDKIELYLVSDPCRLEKRGFSSEECQRKMGTTKFKTFQSMKPFKYKEKLALINGILPHQAKITPC